MNEPKRGIYRHYKGKRYELMDVATHSETLEEMVIYRALYGEKGLWVRPVSMWNEIIDRPDYHGPRFLYIDET